MPDRLRIELTVPVEWSRIEAIRTAIGRCVMAIARDRELEISLAMIAAELLENAMKYGLPGGTVALALWIDADRAHVVVENEIDAGSPHAEKLRRHLEWLRGFARPSEAYLEVLRRIYAGSEAGGGLGIARIAYEGGAEVACDTSRPGQVVVRAACPLKKRAA